MAALLAVGGVQAKTVRKYLRLTDSNRTTYWGQNDRVTFNIPNNEVNAAANIDGGNVAVGWDFSSNKCVGNYTKLVINITSQTNTYGLYIFLGEDGYWTGSKMSKTSFAKDETHLEITLSTLTRNNDGGDNEKLNLEDVNIICIVTDKQTTEAMSFTLGDIYLEKDVEDATYKDYTTTPFDMSSLTGNTYGTNTVTFDEATQTITFLDDIFMYAYWNYASAQDWSDYKFLVTVPQTPWTTGGSRVWSVISDGTNTKDFGYYQLYNQRASVIDLSTEKGSVDLSSISQYEIWNDNNQPRTYGISAMYLTNTPPTRGTNYEGDDEGYSDYRRVIGTADTWGTLCLPFNAAICGAVAYEVVGVDSKDSPSKLYLQSKYGVLEAGKAYLFKTNTTRPLTAYRVGEYETNTPTGKNLKGTFTGADVPNGSYILKNGEWKMSTGTAKVNENRAYLTLTESLVVPAEEALAKGFITMNLEDGTATGIGLTPMDGVEGSKFNVKSSNIFNLTGQRVSKLQKGVNIVNGKKVLVK